MEQQERTIRYRALLDDYFFLVVVAAVVLVAIGGFLTFGAYAQQDTRTETVQTASWESTADFDHSATVVNGTAVYARGETLANRTTYFRKITPRLDGSFLYRYVASDSADLSADASLVLVLRSAEEGEEGNVTEYWRLESTLGEREIESLSPGETVRVPFSMNVTAAEQRLAEVDEQFGGTPGQKELLVETRLQLSGTRNGQPVDRTQTYQLPVELSGNVYRVADSGPVTDGGEQTTTRSIVVDPDPLSAYGGPLLLLVGLGVIGGLGAARYTGRLAVSDQERDWLAYRNAREEFDDWITVARIPEYDDSARRIEVDSLEGLVDVAIDTDQRVLEDRGRDRYFVLDDWTYVFDPPSPEDREVLPPDGATHPGPESLREEEGAESMLDSDGDGSDVQGQDGDSQEDQPEPDREE
jgi:hypothetical protein